MIESSVRGSSYPIDRVESSLPIISDADESATMENEDMEESECEIDKHKSISHESEYSIDRQ